MSSSEDKCEVSKDKYEDQIKMEYFREAINSAEGKKGKSKPTLEGTVPVGQRLRKRHSS